MISDENRQASIERQTSIKCAVQMYCDGDLQRDQIFGVAEQIVVWLKTGALPSSVSKSESVVKQGDGTWEYNGTMFHKCPKCGKGIPVSMDFHKTCGWKKSE